jgi:5-methylcytosine-specific restriction endonuclease McrA
VKTTRRGTTNTNARGNTRDRAARKLWLLKSYASDLWPSSRCRCYRCGEALTMDEITVDRIIPGARGGTYRRNNIRPACSRCNSETGGAVRR